MKESAGLWIFKLEEALETEKHLLQKGADREADLDQVDKSKKKALAKQTDLSAKIAKLKEDIVSKEELVAEARLKNDEKRAAGVETSIEFRWRL